MRKCRRKVFPDSTDSHTIITVTDKIKMQLAKAGKEVFGDDLDAAKLEAMTGSVALANQLEQAFKEADLPATDENIATSIEAFEQLQMLQPMTDGAIKYMLDNQLQPTIENLYMAQFSGSARLYRADRRRYGTVVRTDPEHAVFYGIAGK